MGRAWVEHLRQRLSEIVSEDSQEILSEDEEEGASSEQHVHDQTQVCVVAEAGWDCMR